ncbi:ATP-dependent DNA helicase PcrA [Paraliobacillus sp. PM-2]|uniref:UvrD-helicase domain-containing protein n=1 Tax=Paraliobacillus sp. PM-2 TaxID=1462524 RepID=UPI00061CC7D0|nr:UvrD-helicase domain-containing protein [Paraliobacillus sp. PM-2]CQR46292.1 ATP-dependent DNA helicase PcrA [Paraliobacillus sp. PM-2]
MNFGIYYSDTAREELLNMSEKRIAQLSKRIDCLRNGKWQNGTRVKKLRSINHKRTIYEAREDNARRMLFTIVKNRQVAKQAALLIFHFEVDHDRVIRTAKTLMQDDYDKHQYDQEEEQICSLEEFTEETKPIWGNEAEHFHTYLNQLKSYELDDDTLLRLMRSKELNENEFFEMKISLSSEQRNFARAPLPFLLSGTAGSGKTTIVIHKLLEMDPTSTKLYVTYTKDLCKVAKQMFQRLVKGMDDEHKYLNHTHFKTFDELMRERQKDKAQDVVTRERFMSDHKKLARKKNIEKDFPALMMWEELRGVWKGGLYGKNYILTEKEYLNLTDDQAPNFVGNRKKAYEQFLCYQTMLSQSHKIDEQDLLQEAIEFNNTSYNYIFCDEVQDLSMLHLKFLYELAGKKATNLFLTGDDQQILHHSGFRWPTVKDLFTYQFKHKPPRLEHLTMNYRSVGAITDLARAINKLEKNYTKKKIKAKPPQSLHYGEKPYYFSNISEVEMMETVHDFGPHQAIIVRSDDMKKKLRSIFQKRYAHPPLIFTIFEIKGLEFERILIWDFFQKDAEETIFWENTIRQIHDGNEEKIRSNKEILRTLSWETNLLYVAVTRGSHYCYIFDPDHTAAFWNFKPIHEQMQEHKNLAVLQETEAHTAEATEKDWFQEGKRLFKKKLYIQGYDCFNRLKNTKEIEVYKHACLGYAAKENEKYEDALAHFKQINMHDEVISCLDILEQFMTAYNYIQKTVIRSISDPDEKQAWILKSYLYRVKEFDKKENWNGSGIYCNKLGRHYEAAIRFERSADSVYAKDAYERAIQSCDPKNTKHLKKIKEKYHKLFMQ